MDVLVSRQAMQDIADAIRTKNGSEETYKPSEMADAIRNLSSNANLQDKQVTITENGTTTIVADEGYEGLSSVEVNTNVIDEALNFSSIGYDEFDSDNIRRILQTNKIYSEGIIPSPVPKTLNFQNNNVLMFFPKINTSNVTSLNMSFYGCQRLLYINIDSSNVTNMRACFYNGRNLEECYFTSIGKVTNIELAFNICNVLRVLHFTDWKQLNIELTYSHSLEPSSIHYIIQNAMSLAEGATARTLTLHATAKANWEASEYYEQDLALLEEKGITIA